MDLCDRHRLAAAIATIPVPDPDIKDRLRGPSTQQLVCKIEPFQGDALWVEHIRMYHQVEVPYAHDSATPKTKSESLPVHADRLPHAIPEQPAGSRDP